MILKNGRIAACCDLEAERRANRAFVELELQSPSEAFITAVEGLACDLAIVTELRMKIVLPDGVAVRDLYAAADRHGAAIRRLDCKRDSLQDIFLRAMEGPNGGV
jgi:ABC-2 type transport system ATP-binding protein